MKNRIAFLCLLGICITMILSCRKDVFELQSDDLSFARIIDKGTLVIGFEKNFPPLSYLNEYGSFVGFNVDLAWEVARRLDVALMLQPIDWDKKDILLENGEIDCIWGPLSIVAENENLMTFSKPYIHSAEVIIVLKDSFYYELPNFFWKRLAVQDGASTFALKELKKTMGHYFVTEVKCENYEAILDALRENKADGGIVDILMIGDSFKTKNSDMRIIPKPLSSDKYVIGFKKGDEAIRNIFEYILEEMVRDDFVSKITKKWFGADITLIGK